MYMTASFSNKDSFISSFPICKSFIFLALYQFCQCGVEQKLLEQTPLPCSQP